MPTGRRHYRLRIKSLKWISAVDDGAQGPISRVALIKRAAPTGEIELTARVAKVDTSLGLVFGWAMAGSLDGGATGHVDLQGDHVIVDDDDFLKACADFVESGAAADVLHDEGAGGETGKVVFCMPLVPEVNRALGIRSDVHGLAIAMKPSPATFARFRSGELRAFSIGGIGERELVEKAAPTARRHYTLGALIRKHGGRPLITSEVAGHQHALSVSLGKRRGETSAANSLTPAVSKHGRVLRGDTREHSHRWRFDSSTGRIVIAPDPSDGHTHTVDELVSSEKSATASHIEETETMTPIPLRQPTTVLTTAEQIAKAISTEITIAKGRQLWQAIETKIARAKEAHDAHVAKIAKARGIDIAAASRELYKSNDPELMTLAGEWIAASDARSTVARTLSAPTIERVAKAGAVVKAQLDKTVEEFCLAHNLDRHVAEERLGKISPSYQTTYQQWYDLESQRSAAHTAAQAVANAVMAESQREAAAASQQQVSESQLANERPAEKALRTHVEQLAKSRGVNYARAMDDALSGDPTAQTLYKVIADENNRRQAGVSR